MTPNAEGTMARLHLAAAADSLRVASERLCDWLEATGQDVAGNGHVASADEAAGSSRGAPTAPVSSSPPPIPLGAVVTVTVNGVEWQREDGEWDDAEGGGPPNKADALDFLDRIAELEREVHLARNDEALALSTSREWESYCKRAERERDEARRALAAKQDQGLGASAPNSEGQGPMIPTDGPPSPAPASAPLSETAPLSGAGNTGETGKPRRWWLVVDWDGYPVYAYASQRLAVERVQEDNENVPRPAFTPYSAIPVIEARVTRETVDKLASALFEQSAYSKFQRNNTLVRAHWTAQARAALSALGLTAEGGDDA